MSVQSEITRLSNSKSAIKSAIESKGVSVSGTDTLDSYADKISQIVTPDATIYTGSSDPSSSLGSNGDLYIKI